MIFVGSVGGMMAAGARGGGSGAEPFGQWRSTDGVFRSFTQDYVSWTSLTADGTALRLSDKINILPYDGVVISASGSSLRTTPDADLTIPADFTIVFALRRHAGGGSHTSLYVRNPILLYARTDGLFYPQVEGVADYAAGIVSFDPQVLALAVSGTAASFYAWGGPTLKRTDYVLSTALTDLTIPALTTSSYFFNFDDFDLWEVQLYDEALEGATLTSVLDEINTYHALGLT